MIKDIIGVSCYLHIISKYHYCPPFSSRALPKVARLGNKIMVAETFVQRQGDFFRLRRNTEYESLKAISI